ncbi:MAG: hypothetical protein BWX97_01140 [Firmicutes bacterium ADurb.Bin146]|nr:MAG: hypothetical protein BWX97_01140 [Firmicutes bacterium ADurb.Bin146]
MFTHYSDVICDIGKMLGMDLGLKYAPLKDIKNKLGKVKK